MWRALAGSDRPPDRNRTMNNDTGEAERYYRRDVVKYRPPASRG